METVKRESYGQCLGVTDTHPKGICHEQNVFTESWNNLFIYNKQGSKCPNEYLEGY